MLVGRSIRNGRQVTRRLAAASGGARNNLTSLQHHPHQQQSHHAMQLHRMFAGNANDENWGNSDDSDEPTLTKTADEKEFFDEFDFRDYQDIQEDDDDDDWQKEEVKQQKVRDELDKRTGRGWSDPWELTDEDWQQKRVLDDLPDWTPAMCSRISMERVKIHPDGIPTLTTLATLPLPPPPPPHPGLGNAKAYAKMRKKYIYDNIYNKVVAIASPKIPAILKLSSWNAKQNAIDELYENVETQLKNQEDILGRSPQFGPWVEQALEEYLRSVDTQNRMNAAKGTEGTEDSNDAIADKGDEAVIDDDNADPVFMDLYNKEDGPKTIVPTILHPLRPHPRDGPGRMVEEWELSAHKETKRIMLRHCTRKIAQVLTESPSSRVYVHGRNGVGKSAALAAIVGSARKSDYIVLFRPEGDRLRQHGKYIEVNPKREGIFDLPVLAQEVCEQLLTSHKSDLEGMTATNETMEAYFTQEQLKRLDLQEFSLVTLLETAQERKSMASACYAAVVQTLMTQDEKPFLMVLDDFNCYYDYGKYFHMEYDEHVQKAIPCNQISLFQPALDAMGLCTSEDETSTTPSAVIKRGGIVVATTESHAVARKFTDALSANAALKAQEEDSNDVPLVSIEVPRYSRLETNHIISNMETTGIGRLRFDRGDTVMNKNEMGYLRMVSGAVGQKLLDECVV